MNAARRVPASPPGTLPRVLLLLDRRAEPGTRTERVLKGERDREKANPLLRAGRAFKNTFFFPPLSLSLSFFAQ